MVRIQQKLLEKDKGGSIIFKKTILSNKPGFDNRKEESGIVKGSEAEATQFRQMVTNDLSRQDFELPPLQCSATATKQILLARC